MINDGLHRDTWLIGSRGVVLKKKNRKTVAFLKKFGKWGYFIVSIGVHLFNLRIIVI